MSSKKIGIVTIIDNKNIGNRLQNYALQEFLAENNLYSKTVKNYGSVTGLLKVKSILRSIIKEKNRRLRLKRYINFKKFNKNIRLTKRTLRDNIKRDKKIDTTFDCFFVGSDQVWNCDFGSFSEIYFLNFTSNEKRVAFSASFGFNDIPKEKRDIYKENLSKMKKISVREERGKEIIEELIGRDDIEVLLDPTMLVKTETWEKVMRKPKKLDTIKKQKYILNYFLGNLSEERKKEIERIAKENNCKIINILDKEDPFYTCGPSEFVYLEKNAFLVCTDSFHSSVFAILFNTPFIVFDREDSTTKMNSRLDTLLEKFEIKDRWFNEKIKDTQLKAEYSNVYKILENERNKAKKFIEEALKEEE